MTAYVTRAQFAVMAGLSLETIKKYRTENTLPPPDVTLDNKPLWHTDTVAAWLKERAT